MYSFRNDYSEGAHPKVLKALTDTNFEQTRGYGLDPRCQKARELIRGLCAAPVCQKGAGYGAETEKRICRGGLQPPAGGDLL